MNDITILNAKNRAKFSNEVTKKEPNRTLLQQCPLEKEGKRAI